MGSKITPSNGLIAEGLGLGARVPERKGQIESGRRFEGFEELSSLIITRIVAQCFWIYR